MNDLISGETTRALTSACPHRQAATTGDGASGASDVALAREVDAVEGALTALDAAYAANDRPRWIDTRKQLDHALVFAEDALARSRTEEHVTARLETPALAAARATLAAYVERAKAATEPPAGYTPLAGEQQIVDLLGATSETRSRLDFDAREQAVARWIDGLTRAEARALMTRLRIGRGDDTLVAALARFAAPRRARLQTYLADLPRRLALRGRVEQHGIVAGAALAIAGDLIASAAAFVTPVVTAARTIRAYGEDALADTIHDNVAGVLAGIRDTIAATGIVQPHARLTWCSLDDAAGALAAAIHADVDAMRLDPLSRLSALAAPEDVLGVARELHAGAREWKPEHSVALAALFVAPLDAAIRRIGERTRAWFDERARLPETQELVASCPLDELVAQVMTARGMVVPAAGRAMRDEDAKRIVRAPRAVACEWLGARDRSLWNWVRVTSPGVVTAEDVAHTLCTSAGHDGASQAYRLTVREPCFGVPAELARGVPEMASFAPRTTDVAERQVDASAFDRSTSADELARAQAPASRRTDPPVERSAMRVRMQLGFLRERFGRWCVADALAGATAFVDRRVGELEAGAPEAGSWQAALAAQERALRTIAVEALEVLGELDGHVVPASAPAAMVSVVAGYARSAGASHLPVVAERELQAARRARTLLPVALATQQVRAAAAFAANSEAPTQAGRSPFELVGRAEALRRDVEDRRVNDPDAAEQLSIDARETAVRARIEGIAMRARAVDARADELGLSDHVFDGHLPTVRAMTSELLRRPHGVHAGRIAMWRARLDDVRSAVIGLPPHEQLPCLRIAVNEVESGVSTFVAETELDAWLRSAYQQFTDLRLRQLVLELAKDVGVQVAVGIATSLVGGGMFTALRSVDTIGNAIAASKTAATVVDAAELATEASLMTLGQGAVGGEVSGRELAANLIGYTVAAGAFAPAERALARGGILERGLTSTMGARAARSGLVIAELGAETAAGMVGDVVGHALVRDGGTLPGIEDWGVQGVSIATTRFVAQRMRSLVQRLRTRRAELGPLADELAAESQALADRVDATPSHTPAFRQLAFDLSRHFAGVRRVTSDESAAEVVDHLEQLIAAIPAHCEATLALADLDPVIPGHLYEGTSERIHSVLANIADTNASFNDEYDGLDGVHRLTLGKRTFELREQRAVLHDGSKNAHRRLNKAPIPGLYSEPLLDHKLRGYRLDERTTEDADGVLTTQSRLTNDRVTYDDVQSVTRSFSPEERTLVMEGAFLEKVPRWMKMPGPAMDPIDGTPTITALTLRQMLLMDVPYAGLDLVRMPRVQNIRAMIELHAFLSEGMNIHQAAALTHSVRYAEGAIVQSGHRIDHVKWLPSDTEVTRERLGDIMRATEIWGRPDGSADPAIVAYHDELLAKFGRGKVTRDTMVIDHYDLELLLSPFDKKARFN